MTAKAEAIAGEACQLAAGPERDSFLAGACGDDAALRAQVEELLKADDAAESPKKAGTIRLESAAMGPLSEGPGQVIGRYKLLQLLGEGGFGSVFIAEQAQPGQRKVALQI